MKSCRNLGIQNCGRQQMMVYTLCRLATRQQILIQDKQWSDPSLSQKYSTDYIFFKGILRMNWLRNRRKISGRDLLEMLKRIERAYKILELNSQAPMILEKNPHERLFEVRSTVSSDKFYTVDAEIKTCTCPDFSYRYVKCKHILAAEFASTP